MKELITNINDIFKYYDDITLFANYLKIPREIIVDSIINGKAINSPIGKDRYPSASFYQVEYKGIIKTKFRDFRGYFWGDIVDLILQNEGWNLKDNFLDLVNLIDKLSKDNNNTIGKEILKYDKKEINFIIYPREFNSQDKKYWGKYNIDIEDLKDNYVYAVEAVYTEKDTIKEIYRYRDYDLCYAYYIYGNNNNIYWQLYFPNRRSYKFLTNSTKYLIGINTIKKADILIITKANKDRIFIKKLAKEYNIDLECLSVIGEGNLPNNDMLKIIDSFNYKNKYVLFDLDKVGIKNMKKMKELGYIPIILPKYYYKGKVLKDITDIYKIYPDEVNLLASRFAAHLSCSGIF